MERVQNNEEVIARWPFVILLELDQKPFRRPFSLPLTQNISEYASQQIWIYEAPVSVTLLKAGPNSMHPALVKV